MPEDLNLSQIGSSQLPPAFRGLHSLGVRKRCQIIFACYFWKSSITITSSCLSRVVTVSSSCLLQIGIISSSLGQVEHEQFWRNWGKDFSNKKFLSSSQWCRDHFDRELDSKPSATWCNSLQPLSSKLSHLTALKKIMGQSFFFLQIFFQGEFKI